MLPPPCFTARVRFSCWCAVLSSSEHSVHYHSSTHRTASRSCGGTFRHFGNFCRAFYREFVKCKCSYNTCTVDEWSHGGCLWVAGGKPKASNRERVGRLVIRWVLLLLDTLQRVGDELEVSTGSWQVCFQGGKISKRAGSRERDRIITDRSS